MRNQIVLLLLLSLSTGCATSRIREQDIADPSYAADQKKADEQRVAQGAAIVFIIVKRGAQVTTGAGPELLLGLDKVLRFVDQALDQVTQKPNREIAGTPSTKVEE